MLNSYMHATNKIQFHVMQSISAQFMHLIYLICKKN